jgi:predicted RNA-binding protein with PIN domain
MGTDPQARGAGAPADGGPPGPGAGPIARAGRSDPGARSSAAVTARSGAGVPPARGAPIPDTAEGEGRAGTARASAPLVRRVPLRLPGGIFDDSVEAAEHLLRTVGVVLVVDGYNVTMTGWPALAAADQRRRLVTALAELAARTATEAEIVFDGADVDTVPVPAQARSLVHVRFSPAGVEADDVVLDLVAQLPPAWPVVVASSDNRVRDGARALGANVVHARQLLDALRR